MNTSTRLRSVDAVLLFVLLLFLTSCLGHKTMSSFVDDYFRALFEFNPSTATGIGFHEYDSKLEDLSAAAIHARIEKLKQLKTQLSNVRAGKLAEADDIDALMLDSQINAELLDLETLQTWRHNPMNYVGLPGSSIDSLMKRNFAAPAERLRSVTARLKAVPALLDQMKANIENPPHEFTDLAFRMAHGSVGFFRDDVAGWAKTAAGTDSVLLADFTQSNEAAAKSFEDASTWLEKTLLPVSKGNY